MYKVPLLVSVFQKNKTNKYNLDVYIYIIKEIDNFLVHVVMEVKKCPAL